MIFLPRGCYGKSLASVIRMNQSILFISFSSAVEKSVLLMLQILPIGIAEQHACTALHFL